MTWQERIVSLGNRFGPGAAKTAVKTLLSSLVPGGALLSDLVEGAFNAVDKSKQDTRDVEIHQGLQATAEGINQLEQALQIVEDDLGDILAQLVQFREQPEVVARILKLAKENDQRCREAGERLSRLEQLYTILLRVQVEIQTIIKGIDKKLGERQISMSDCCGAWLWFADGANTLIYLRADGSWTAKSDSGVGRFGNVTEFKGTWNIRQNRIQIVQTHYWAILVWKEHEPQVWLDASIRNISAAAIELADGNTLREEKAGQGGRRY